MSLVDYASSSSSSDSEDERAEIEEDKEEDHSLNQLHQNHNQQAPIPPPTSPPPQPPPAPIDRLRRNPVASNDQQSTVVTSSPSSSSLERLPDASVLLGSPSFSADLFTTNNHSSRVAAAMPGTVPRKREANGSAQSHSRSKVPRGNLPPSRSVPDTLDGALVPPQLRGRSNVVTEDMNNLFVRRHAQSSQ